MKLNEIIQLDEITRRDFLKGAAVGALGMAGLSTYKGYQADREETQRLRKLPPVDSEKEQAWRNKFKREMDEYVSHYLDGEKEWAKTWDKLNRGMSEREVQQILGKPKRRQIHSWGDLWEYAYGSSVVFYGAELMMASPPEQDRLERIGTILAKDHFKATWKKNNPQDWRAHSSIIEDL